MKKRIVCVLLAASFVFGVTGLPVHAMDGDQVQNGDVSGQDGQSEIGDAGEEDKGIKEENGYQYVLNEEQDEAIIQKYVGEETSIVIPSTLGGYPVTEIAENAFEGQEGITAIEISAYVERIGKDAFAGCSGVEKLKVGCGVGTVTADMTNGLTGLKEIVFANGVREIGEKAFNSCTALERVTVPASVQKVGSNAFYKANDLMIYTTEGSAAEKYAKNNRIAYTNYTRSAETIQIIGNRKELKPGEQLKLRVSGDPIEFTDSVTWRSNSTGVISVSDQGVVKATGTGKAVISVFAGDCTAVYDVEVVQLVTSIYLSKSSLELSANGTARLEAIAYPDNAKDRGIVWSSSNESVAVVSEDGEITALKKGRAIITAAAADGSGVKKTCEVTVTNSIFECHNMEELQSAHNYADNCEDTWVYYAQKNSVTNIELTFDERTKFENLFDIFYIYDSAGALIGKYSGEELANETISVAGDQVKMKLVSDEAGNDWGFKVVEIKETTRPVTEIFSDIQEKDWFYNAVQYVYENRIMNGKGEGIFDPNGYITREQFAQVLYNHMEKPEIGEAQVSFPDVAENGWYRNAVIWAKQNRIANGNGDGTFGVGQNITREALALMLYHYAELRHFDVATQANISAKYADGDKVSSWARTAMDWAISQGIISGKGSADQEISTIRLDPQGSATRAECASMIRKLILKNTEQENN